MKLRMAPQEVRLEKYSLEEVSKHNTPNDCWLIIWGKVYDVSAWVPHHPGGNMIFVRAGKDSSQLFESYHPLYVRKLLGRYYIGEVDEVANDSLQQSTVEYYESGTEPFYLTLKERVEAYFEKNKVNPRVHPNMLPKSILVIAGYMLFFYITFFGLQSFALSVLSALAMGYFAAQIGLSIQHDANHGAYSNVNWFGYLMSTSLDFLGASSFMWRQQHVVGHHSFTNVDNYDPDIRVKDPDLRRVTSQQPIQKYHSFQHIYLGALYGLLALKGVLLDDFAAYISGSIGPVKIPKMTNLETGVFFGGKILYTIYMFVLPSLFSHHSIFQRAVLYVTSQLVCGWTLAFLFQVAHVVPKADFPVVDSSHGRPKVHQGWAAMQVRTTTNFSTNSMLWTHLSGGLNYQIEHHLFPSVCHLHYPSIHPIVKAVCEEFNVPYYSYPSFWAALEAHFAYLKKVGSEHFELRLSG